MALNHKFDIGYVGALDIFRKWDVNGSGTISLPELECVLVAAGVAEDNVPTLLSSADANCDGQINYELFSMWIFGMAAKTAQADTKVEITVNRLASDPFKLVVAEDATVEVLKQRICEYAGSASNAQKLIFDEKLVEKGNLLSECGIKAGANITLLVVMPEPTCYHKVVFSPGRDHGLLEVHWRGSNEIMDIEWDSQAARAGVTIDMRLHRINGIECSKKLLKEFTRGPDDYEIVFTEVCDRVAWTGGGRCETCGFEPCWHRACGKTALQVGVDNECTVCGLCWSCHNACSRYEPDSDYRCKTCFLSGNEHEACSKFRAERERESWWDGWACDACGKFYDEHTACVDWEYNGKDVCCKCGLCAERHDTVKACEEYKQGEFVKDYQHRCRICGVLSDDHKACNNWEYDGKLGCGNCGLIAQRHEDVQACGNCEYNPDTKPGSCRNCGVLKACSNYDSPGQKYNSPCDRCGLGPNSHKACGRFDSSICTSICKLCGLYNFRHEDFPVRGQIGADGCWRSC